MRKSKKQTATGEESTEWQEQLEAPIAVVNDKDNESEEELSRVNHGAVLTGGIDSTVMLYQLAKTLPKDAEIFPIVLGSKNDNNILRFLDDLKIKNDITTFDIDDSDADETKLLPLLEWAQKNRVNVIHFAANANEQEESIPNKMYDYFGRLNDLSYINISNPLITVTKEKIIQDAVDIYGIDLSELAEPQSVEEGDITGEKYKRIRENGFKKAFSLKHKKWLEDPFATKPETEHEKTET